ncbi:hypothetical protein [Acidovorax sp. BL-A-41-H1]|uniref:hypothetical protein n=1 Tax=Acidovorax sp. BL-A-41-H1 TaxID=3421102 RepID=UPI003F78CBB7
MTPPTQFQKMRANRIRTARAAETSKQVSAQQNASLCSRNRFLFETGREPTFTSASNYAALHSVWRESKELRAK